MPNLVAVEPLRPLTKFSMLLRSLEAGGDALFGGRGGLEAVFGDVGGGDTEADADDVGGGDTDVVAVDFFTVGWTE